MANQYRDPHYKRDWMRRFRANESPEAKAVRHARRNAQRNAKRWVANPDSKRLPPGQCRKCKRVFPLTAEFFVPLKNESKRWEGLSAECRKCRNKRYRAWYAKDPTSQVARALAYVKANPAPKRARDMVRYARRKKRGCPPWANQGLIESLYAIADDMTRRSGVPHEVDHIYPLMHPLCCGLHVPWNLRVVPIALNQAKGNRLPFDLGNVRDCTAFL